MRITVNGDVREVMATSLSELLAELDLAGAIIATALNGHFVPATKRAASHITEGDKIEIVAPMQGG